MAKLALCVTASSIPNWEELLLGAKTGGGLVITGLLDPSITLSMQDRATCETDESYLQIIPYVVIRYRNGVFGYTRGGSGEESRLHQKRSIGVGGHVDSFPTDITLEQHLREEASRELKEEVGIDVLPGVIEPLGLVFDPCDAVGRVHLGVLCLFELDAIPETLFEEGVIENAQFFDIRFLLEKENFETLEGWSKLALRYINWSDTL